MSRCNHKGIQAQIILTIALVAIVPVNFVLAQGTLANALVAHFPFDGDATDQSGSGNDGTVFGAKMTADRHGNPNSAYKFDGIGDYISISDALELRGGTDPISVTAWFKATTVDSLRPIITKYLDSSAKDWGLRVKDESVTFSSEKQQDDYLCSDTLNVINSNQWYFAVFVAEEPNLTLYLDGVETNNCTNFISHWSGTSATVEIGRIGYLDVYFAGLIDDVRIYNRALTPDEVQALFVGPQTSVAAADLSLPDRFELNQNYPNPFNPATQIRFDLPHTSQVRINIYNTAGQVIRALVSQPFAAGSHTVIWNGRDDLGREAASGLYLYSIDASGFTGMRKMVKLK